MTHKGRGYTLRSVRIEGIKGRGCIPGSGRFEHEGRAYTLRSGKFEETIMRETVQGERLKTFSLGKGEYRRLASLKIYPAPVCIAVPRMKG